MTKFRCESCKKDLDMSRFYFKNGRRQRTCKKCFGLARAKKALFGWQDRFWNSVSAEDAEKCRIAHEKLMAEIRTTEGD